MKGVNEKSNQNLCRQCRFFYITWDRKFPNGCKALGFKSLQLPSIQVYKSSGMPCQYFVKKSIANKGT